ncbi:MAG: hypothetical protein AAFO59_10340 [Cyanobacteria bacterium J06607_17]
MTGNDTEANWYCTECGRPCRQPGESPEEAIARIEWSNHPKVLELWDVMEDAEPVVRLWRFKLTVAHLDHEPEDCDRTDLKALCAPCHGTYDLKQMGP